MWILDVWFVRAGPEKSGHAELICIVEKAARKLPTTRSASVQVRVTSLKMECLYRCQSGKVPYFCAIKSPIALNRPGD
jgi:hypothetical protein